MSCGRQGRAVSMCLLRDDPWFSAQAPESLPMVFIPTEACFLSVHVARKTSSCALDFPLWLCPILPCTAKIPSETNVTVLPTPPLQATAFIGLHISLRTRAAPCPAGASACRAHAQHYPRKTLTGPHPWCERQWQPGCFGIRSTRALPEFFSPDGQLLLKETLRVSQL